MKENDTIDDDDDDDGHMVHSFMVLGQGVTIK